MNPSMYCMKSLGNSIPLMLDGAKLQLLFRNLARIHEKPSVISVVSPSHFVPTDRSGPRTLSVRDSAA